MPGFPSVVRRGPRSPGQLAGDDKRSAHWHGSVARSDRAVYLPEWFFSSSPSLSVCLSVSLLVLGCSRSWAEGPIARCPGDDCATSFCFRPISCIVDDDDKVWIISLFPGGVGRRCFGRFQGAGGAGGRRSLVQATHIPTSRLSREPNRAWRFEASGRLSRFVGVGFAGKLQETGRAWGWGFRPGSRVLSFWLG